MLNEKSWINRQSLGSCRYHDTGDSQRIAAQRKKIIIQFHRRLFQRFSPKPAKQFRSAFLIRVHRFLPLNHHDGIRAMHIL